MKEISWTKATGKLLKQNNIDFLEISGRWEEREQKAIENIEKLIAEKKKLRINTL